FEPMELHWPREIEQSPAAKRRIMKGTQIGLDNFAKLFRENGTEHTRILSRVHPEGDLRVQSYILAAPSWVSNDVRDEEVQRKALMVGVSHWLDDLVDGREAVGIRRMLRGLGEAEWNELWSCTGPEKPLDLFRRFYRSVVIASTSQPLFERLENLIKEHVKLEENLPLVLYGLNRVALSAAIFDPGTPADERDGLISRHNLNLVETIRNDKVEVDKAWKEKVTKLF